MDRSRALPTVWPKASIRSLILLATLSLTAVGCSSGKSEDTATPSSVVQPAESGCDGSVEAPSTDFVVDDCGRVLILRGVNVESSSKGGKQSDSHLPATGLKRQEELFRWGWNAVRFLVFWGAIEPEKGKFDDTYLDEVEKWLDWYEDHDIDVVLDMHQDLYGWKVGGNGAPDWAVETDGQTFVGSGGVGPWYLNATDPATQTAYQNFWDVDRGHPEFRDEYQKALVHLVERFADHPAVIGYDVMNEPVFANGDLDETLAIATLAAQGKFENPNLNEFMQTAIDGIRAVDGDAWIFVEPTSLLNAFPYPGDLKGLTDPREKGPRLVYAGHLYETAVHDGAGYDEASPYVDQWQQLRSAEAKQLNAALWPGEWGGTADQQGFDRYVADVTGMLDEEMAGWSYWSWDPGGWGPLDGNGAISENGKLLLRVQPRAVAGEPTTFAWDAATKTFTLTWNSRDGVSGTTDLAVPADLYTGGFEVTSTDAEGTWTYETDETHNVVRISAGDAATHTVTVKPQ